MVEYKQDIVFYSLVKEPTSIKKAKISKSKDVSDYARNFWEGLDIYESFHIIMLNRANNTIGYAKISQGGVSSTVADPKLIAKYSVDALASSIILLHNHPSGALAPSNSDVKLTEKIVKGLEYLDIKVLDHIILTNESYYSFLDNNKMNF